MIYADFNGSSEICPQVKEHLIKRLQDGPFANPNAIHSIGRNVLKGMEKCRNICAQALGARPDQIIFNSGASEGITHIFHSVLETTPKDGKNKIIISGIEHSAVVNAAEGYKDFGYDVVKIAANEKGQVLVEDLKKELDAKTAFVSVMAANNETGVIQPWQEIVTVCQENNIPFFSDTTQWIGKTSFNFEESGMDYAVMSGHKIGALTGVGITLVKDIRNFKSLIYGGGQERGLRGGTQNYIGIETLAIALENSNQNIKQNDQKNQLRKNFEDKIKAEFPEVVVIGGSADRIPCTTLMGFPGIHGQAVQIELESQDIFVSTSSACSDNEPATSKVLKSMGIDDGLGRSVIRISLGPNQDLESAYNKIADGLFAAYRKLGKLKY